MTEKELVLNCLLGIERKTIRGRSSEELVVQMKLEILDAALEAVEMGEVYNDGEGNLTMDINYAVMPTFLLETLVAQFQKNFTPAATIH